jgi:GDPmannose 4,6-dehydratase
MKAIIFGVNGQDGYYLNLLLSSQNIEVIGVSRSNPNWFLGDVSDKMLVENLIRTQLPEYIFHLAANSTTNHDALFENHNTIATGTLNILEAVYRYSKRSKVFISGSALQFVNKGLPISETDHFEARDTYSISRIQSVYAARYYRSIGVQVYVGFFFHHDSPLRSDRHLNMKIAKAAIRIQQGSYEKLEIDDISTIKEYNYAGDLMMATWMLVSQNHFFEAVIGSGKGYSINTWIEICFEIIGKDWTEHVTQLNRQSAFPSLVSNPKTISSIGWRNEHSIHSLARMIMDYLLK